MASVSCEPNGVYAMSARRMIQAVFAVGLVVIGGAAGASPSVVFAAQPNGQVLNVTVTSSRVSLTVREAPLAEVLAAVARQAGVKIVLSGGRHGRTMRAPAGYGERGR